MKNPDVLFEDLGRMGYQQAWDYQEMLLQNNVRIKRELGADVAATEMAAATTNHLLFVEHHPVYTIGKSGKMEHVLMSEADRVANNIEFFRTNRGGDITFHGPGQLVGYPVLDLEQFYTDIGRYLRELEEVVIITLKELGIVSGRSAGETGVWLDAGVNGRERKICAMGVRCSRWITMHGFALNVNTDLSYFDHIIPCGIHHKKVTSMKAELEKDVEIAEVKEVLRHSFEKVFNASLR